MNELIPIKTSDQMEPIISGRDLHHFLEVETPYTMWFKRMIEFGFSEGTDFITNLLESTGGRPSEDHALKIDMAKEISMLQRNDRGKQARMYFIAVEKEFNSPEKIMARALRIADETINRLSLVTKQQEQVIGELKPKADYVDRILKNPGLVTITQIAKDYGMSGTEMNKILHDLGVQYKQSDQWLLYTRYQSKGYTFSDKTEITRRDGRKDIKMNTKWTQKGVLFLYELLKENNIIPAIEKL
ncbi:phage antirepressor KilAC domain-containing protein [Proteiniclasticum sp. BAD-10]|uniref:Phage antirepressor KilAC domain-containing protein n=1 Tax=Proteiniclasticum sediminis TaxID=2804028 RepID=A0A941CS63_9CLOT|nr:phage antirepressor KilAC domain-containing protein [Proteiniclasticum sediminis]MBR0576788.1 phage antirepressor KilAC domain-containing protein [Proteiniclasticum sediminis]